MRLLVPDGERRVLSISEPNGPPDKRRAHRKRALLSGRLSYGAEAFSTGCVIRDINESGARISVDNPQYIPEHVILIELKDLIAFEATVRWRQGKMMGLSFESSISLDDPSSARSRALRRLAMAAKNGPGS